MKRLKELIKKPGYYFSFAILAVIIIASIVFFSELRKTSNQIEHYTQEISKISSSLNEFSESVRQRTAKLSSAELLLNNTNLILSTVYYGTADEGKQEEARNFTAFSMLYKDKFYIITAGHCVEMDNVKYENFKFKSNKGKTWIMPKLLDYNNDYKNNLDYAIFYNGSPVNMGLLSANPGEDMAPQYVLGNLERSLNLVKRYSDAKEGESGSPILNSNCHVIGLMIKSDGSFTPIKAVLDALAKLPTE